MAKRTTQSQKRKTKGKKRRTLRGTKPGALEPEVLPRADGTLESASGELNLPQPATTAPPQG